MSSGHDRTSRPIGIFDSGVGGLTVLKELLELLPLEDTIYLGDTARVPYGIRSPETVTRYAVENAEFLLRGGIKLIVVACNTASAVSLEVLRSMTSVPVVGVIEPGAEAAVRATNNGRIGVIGTEATIQSSAYHRTIRAIDPGVEVIGAACPLFVPLVEEGWTDDELARAVASRYLGEFRRSGVDTLVLGCTHYPLLKGAIGEVLGQGIRLIDSAVETARAVKEVLNSRGLLRRENDLPGRRYFVTDAPQRFKRIGERFLGSRLEHIDLVEIPPPESRGRPFDPPGAGVAVGVSGVRSQRGKEEG